MHAAFWLDEPHDWSSEAAVSIAADFCSNDNLHLTSGRFVKEEPKASAEVGCAARRAVVRLLTAAGSGRAVD